MSTFCERDEQIIDLRCVNAKSATLIKELKKVSNMQDYYYFTVNLFIFEFPAH